MGTLVDNAQASIVDSAGIPTVVVDIPVTDDDGTERVVHMSAEVFEGLGEIIAHARQGGSKVGQVLAAFVWFIADRLDDALLHHSDREDCQLERACVALLRDLSLELEEIAKSK